MKKAATVNPLDKIKKEFIEWTKGFELEGDTIEEMQDYVKQRHWSLECELHQEMKYFLSQLEQINNK